MVYNTRENEKVYHLAMVRVKKGRSAMIATKVVSCVALAATLATNVALAETTWYFNGGNDSINGGITTPSKWVNASGTAATAFSVDDYYIVRGNSRLRVNNKTFEGGPLQIGDLSNNTRGGILNDAASSTTAFPNGLCFDSGYYWVNIYISYEAQRDGALNSDGITVRSPADKPFVFHCSNGVNYNNRRLFINAPMSSDANAGIVVGPAVVSGSTYACGTNFTVSLCGDCSDYKGLISVTTAQNVAEGKWDVRLGVGDITVGGKVRLATGTAITAWRGACNTAQSVPTECTIGSLELAARSMILVEGNTTTPTNGIIHVRDELTVSKPVTVKLNYNARTPSTNKATRLTILTVPLSSRLDADDFALNLGTTSAAQYYDLIVEENAAAQTKSLVAVFGPTVAQTGHYGDNEGAKDRAVYYSSFTNATYWSDSLLPHGNAHYYSERHYLRTLVDETMDYDFPGLSLTQVGGRFTILTKSFNVPEYIARAPANGNTTTIWLGQAYNINKVIKVNRFVAKSGIVDLGAYNSQTLVIDGVVVGAADFALRGVTSTSATKGSYRFTGLNTNFTGNITVEQRTTGEYLTFNDKYQTLYVEDGRNLGGAKDEFDAQALKLAAMSRLSADGDVTLQDGLNRGLYIEGVGRLYAEAAKTLTVNWPITMHGKLWKEGAGTLVLGGDVRFDSANGAPEATSNLFEVASGSVKVAAHNAMDGLETTFHSGTSLVLALNPEDENLTKYGILNAKTETPFTLGISLAKLPLTVDASACPAFNQPSQTFGLVTVTNLPPTVAAIRGLLPKIDKLYKGVRQRVFERENDGEGTVTFELRLEQAGMVLMVW